MAERRAKYAVVFTIPRRRYEQATTNVVSGDPVAVKKSSDDLRFSAAVAMYAMILRESVHIGDIKLADVQDLAKGAMGDDEHMYRAEFTRQVERTGLIIDLASR
ncbi:MAG: DUF3520 domain-containing protein [Candidatus Krumholzibacteria bacterium]|nr:DUF3520 domain-containing protein [Candidatus Krumholzibacteria bacterium]